MNRGEGNSAAMDPSHDNHEPGPERRDAAGAAAAAAQDYRDYLLGRVLCGPTRGAEAAADATAAREREERRLATLRRTGLLDSSPEPALDHLTRLARRLLRAPVALVSLVDAERQFFGSQQGLAEPLASSRQTPLSHSFCKHVVAAGAPLLVADACEHPLVRDNPAVPEFGVRAYLGAPLRAPDGQVLGSFCVLDTAPRVWSEGDVSLAGELAEAAGAVVALRLALADRGRAGAGSCAT